MGKFFKSKHSLASLNTGSLKKGSAKKSKSPKEILTESNDPDSQDLQTLAHDDSQDVNVADTQSIQNVAEEPSPFDKTDDAGDLAKMLNQLSKMPEISNLDQPQSKSVLHTVINGDTWDSLSTKYHGNTDNIDKIKSTNLSIDTLKTGQILTVPIFD